MTQPVGTIHQQPCIPISLLTMCILPLQVGNLSTSQKQSQNQGAKTDGVAEGVFGTGWRLSVSSALSLKEILDKYSRVSLKIDECADKSRAVGQ